MSTLIPPIPLLLVAVGQSVSVLGTCIGVSPGPLPMSHTNSCWLFLPSRRVLAGFALIFCLDTSGACVLSIPLAICPLPGPRVLGLDTVGMRGIVLDTVFRLTSCRPSSPLSYLRQIPRSGLLLGSYSCIRHSCKALARESLQDRVQVSTQNRRTPLSRTFRIRHA